MENLIQISKEIFNTKKSVVKRSGSKQILITKVDGGYYALDNRCPHEGYPLSEGSSDGDSCVLTCNWHNWKFDLKTGKCLVGGDNVKTYPLNVTGDFIEVDISDPTPEQVQQVILEGFKIAFEKREYGRISRELSRLHFNKLDPLVALKQAIHWSWNKLEYGTSHAYAVTNDWLRVYDLEVDPVKRIVALTEAIDHISFDALRYPVFSYTEEFLDYNSESFLQAIEDENEELSITYLNGAIKQGFGYKELERDLIEAALSHYRSFGHTIIYVYKLGELIARLDDKEIEAKLLSTLVRHMTYATKEDLIPEFRGYHETVDSFEFGEKQGELKIEATGVKSIYKWLLNNKEYNTSSYFECLLKANAKNFLEYDMNYQFNTDNNVNDNVGWLSMTHALTQSNAIHYFCTRYPEFWKKGIVQMASFWGRNIKYTNPKINLDEWRVESVDSFRKHIHEFFYDHGLALPIFSSHIIKTSLAIFEEYDKTDNEELKTYLLASLNRFSRSPIKAKHVLRTIKQGFQLVFRDFSS